MYCSEYICNRPFLICTIISHYCAHRLLKGNDEILSLAPRDASTVLQMGSDTQGYGRRPSEPESGRSRRASEPGVGTASDIKSGATDPNLRQTGRLGRSLLIGQLCQRGDDAFPVAKQIDLQHLAARQGHVGRH